MCSYDLHIKERGEKPKASEQVPGGALVDCLHQTLIVTLEYS